MPSLLKALLGRFPLLVTLTVALAIGLASPLAATATGVVHPLFNFDPNVLDPNTGSVQAVAVQPDGCILVGMDSANPATCIIRLKPNGTVDTTFSPTVAFNDGYGGQVSAIAVLDDGRIVIGGSFNQVGNIPHNALACLLATGAPDISFNPALGPNSQVFALFPQPDGKILVGGYEFPGNNLLRFFTSGSLSGTLDPDFVLNTPSAPILGGVNTLALLPNGDIIFGGNFSFASGFPRTKLARVNTHGVLVNAYAPVFYSSLSDASVDSIVLQSNGQLVVGGSFELVNSIPRQNLARLDDTGSLDLAFHPGADSNATSLALQTDGQLLYSGPFGNTGGMPRNNLARLLANSPPSLDLVFNPQAGSTIYGLALQSEGSPILVGSFDSVGNNNSYQRIARLVNDQATESLTLPAPGTVQWLRSGSSPESHFVTFELSTNNGGTWSTLGANNGLDFCPALSFSA